MRIYSHGQRARRTCLHAHLVTAVSGTEGKLIRIPDTGEGKDYGKDIVCDGFRRDAA